MKRVPLILSNDFHNTTVRLLARTDDQGELWLTTGQIQHARRQLCGIASCQCSGSTGERGPQEYRGPQDGYIDYRPGEDLHLVVVL